MKHWKKADNERLAELKAKGLSWVAIGEQIGTSDHSCRRHWERLQAKSKGEKVSSDRRKDAHRYSVAAGPLDPDLPDKSTPKFANDALHLRMIARALMDRRAA